MTEIEAFRRQMPPPLQARPLNLPEHFETRLPNGLGLVVVEDKRLPLISFRLAFRSGDANDPPALPCDPDRGIGLRFHHCCSFDTFPLCR